MNKKSFSVLSTLIIAVLLAAIPAVYAQTSSGGFTNEPDKTMASAHESFLKGEMNKAAEQITKAAAYVRKQADKVAKDTREGVKKAADDLDKLGQGVKKGTVKSGDELNKHLPKWTTSLPGPGIRPRMRRRNRARIRAMRSGKPAPGLRAQPNGLLPN